MRYDKGRHVQTGRFMKTNETGGKIHVVDISDYTNHTHPTICGVSHADFYQHHSHHIEVDRITCKRCRKLILPTVADIRVGDRFIYGIRPITSKFHDGRTHVRQIKVTHTKLEDGFSIANVKGARIIRFLETTSVRIAEDDRDRYLDEFSP